MTVKAHLIVMWLKVDHVVPSIMTTISKMHEQGLIRADFDKA